MRILKVTKKNSRDVIVHLDNGEKLFLAYEILMKNGLRKGDEISGDFFSLLITQNQKYFIKQSAIRLLSRRMHSYVELKLKLLQKKYDKELIEEVLKELLKSNFLDDHKFAILFAEEKSSGSWGKAKIKAGLINRGINREIIDEVLEKVSSEENDYNTALNLGKKKLRLIAGKNLDSKKAAQKISSFLFSKGFDFDICRKVVNELIKEE